MQFGRKGVREPLNQGIAGVIGRAAYGAVPPVDNTKPPPVRWFSMTASSPTTMSHQVDFRIGDSDVEVQQHGATRGTFDRQRLLTWMFDPEPEPLCAGQVSFSLEPIFAEIGQVTMSLPDVDRYQFSTTELIELQVRLLVWGQEPIGTWFYGRSFG